MHSPANVRLSVLDTAPIVDGSTARQALHNTVDLARLADDLGYHRYWVPEHHSMRGVASAEPSILIARLADATHRIRVGSGGVLLPNHPPLLVAERFGMLEALYPGRIDLGLGRAPGGPGPIAEAIRRSADAYADQVKELLDHFDPPENPVVRAVPAPGNLPPVWLLGSGNSSAQLAANLGLPFAFAHHLNPEGAQEAIRTYRNGFQASDQLIEPTILVSVSVIAADTDEHAEWLAGSTRLKVLSRIRGRRILLPSPEDAAAYPYTDEDRAEIAARSAAVLTGSPPTVARKLQEIVDRTGTTELMLTTPVYEHAARRHSYELAITAATQLTPSPG